MSHRDRKRLVLIVAGIAALACAIEIGVVLYKHRFDQSASALMLPLLIAIIMSTGWSRLSKLEAEHGADYEPPEPRYAMGILAAAGACAVILVVVAAILILRR